MLLLLSLVASGDELVIEEFLEGEEASFFALVDGEQVVPLIAAQVRTPSQNIGKCAHGHNREGQ